MARTANVCWPAASTSTAYGSPGHGRRAQDGVARPDQDAVEQALELELEVERLVVGAGELEDDLKLAVRAGGPLTMRVSGGVVSGPSMISHS